MPKIKNFFEKGLNNVKNFFKKNNKLEDVAEEVSAEMPIEVDRSKLTNIGLGISEDTTASISISQDPWAGTRLRTPIEVDRTKLTDIGQGQSENTIASVDIQNKFVKNENEIWKGTKLDSPIEIDRTQLTAIGSGFSEDNMARTLMSVENNGSNLTEIGNGIAEDTLRYPRTKEDFWAGTRLKTPIEVDRTKLTNIGQGMVEDTGTSMVSPRDLNSETDPLRVMQKGQSIDGARTGEINANTSRTEKTNTGNTVNNGNDKARGGSIEAGKQTQETYGLDEETYNGLSSSKQYRLGRAYSEKEEATKAAQEWTEKVRGMDSKDWTKELEEKQKAIIKRQQNAQKIYDKMIADPTTIDPGLQDYVLGNPKTTAGVLGGGALGYLALNLSSSRGQLTNQQLYGQEDLI